MTAIRGVTHVRASASRWIKQAVGSVAIAATLTLAGCADGVELNGKVFDLLGVSPGAQAAAKAEPKMQPRTGLVLPPDTARLPDPGSEEANAAAVAQIDDPDKRRAMAAAERERLHKAYCSGEMNWKERAVKTDVENKSPYGPCGLVGGMLNQ